MTLNTRTSWATLREQDNDIRTAVYQRLGLPVGQEQDDEAHSATVWCRQCKTSFPAGSIRIGSAPRPHWYEPLCPSRVGDEQFCDGSWEDFDHRQERAAS